MYIIDKDIIEIEILPNLPKAKRGFVTTSSLTDVVNCILYKLKTGMQWRFLPVDSLFSNVVLHYKTVFGHYRKWCKSGAWKACWVKLLEKHKDKIDLSSADIDGSHTPAMRGGEEVSYQGRKKRKTTNSIFLTDRQGIPLAMSTPMSGNHHDLFNIENSLDEIFETLKKAEISIDGLFLNADSGFDAETFRNGCFKEDVIPNIDQNKRNKNIDNDYFFDKELYKLRYGIERTNAWMDSYRTILYRFDTTVSSWEGWNYIAFMIIALKKFKKNKSR